MRIALAAALALAAGCLGGSGIESPGDWVIGECPGDSAATPAMPRTIVAANETEARVLTREGAGDYAVGAAIPKHRYSPIAVGGERVFVTRGGAIVAHAHDGAVLASTPFGQVGAMAYADGHLWVAGKTNFTAFDAGLRRVGQVPVAPPAGAAWPSGKIVDRIHVTDGTAYLVDDIATPFWVFVVDVADPARPTVVADGELFSVNGHPGPQMLDDENWYVIVTESVRSGTFSSAEVLSHQAVASGAVQLYARSRHGDEPASGFLLLPGRAELPAWSILARDDERYLAQVEFHEARPHGACLQPLPACASPCWSAIVQQGEVVGLSIGPQLRLYGVAGAPQLVHSQGLGFQPNVLLVP